jgi:YVTN family beta-propeller protein
VEKRGYRLGLGVSIMAALLGTALLGAPAASGKARVIKTLGPKDGTKDSPANITINRKTNTVYVAHIGGEDGSGFGPDMVSVIDGRTDRIVTNVVVDDHPFGLAVDQKANRVYVGTAGGKPATIGEGGVLMGGGGTILVIDGRTNTVREEFDVPPPPGAHLPGTTSPAETGFPAHLAFDPETGYLWVANTAEVGGQGCCTVPGKLSVYDTKKKRWLKGGADGIPAGVSPIQPVIDNRRNRVYVTSIDSNRVTVVNSHTLRRVTRIPVLPEPYGAAIDPRRHRLYIGHFDSRAAAEDQPLRPLRTVVEVLDTRTNRLLDPVYAGRFTRNLAVDTSTGRVYVNNLAAARMTILGPRLGVRDRVGVGLGPRGIAVNPSTDKIYVGNGSESVGRILGGPGLDGRPDTISVIRDPGRRRKAPARRKRRG